MAREMPPNAQAKARLAGISVATRIAKDARTDRNTRCVGAVMTRIKAMTAQFGEIAARMFASETTPSRSRSR